MNPGPNPGSRSSEAAAESGCMNNKVMGWIHQGRTFLRDVQSEAKRVTWLDMRQTAAQTAVALVFVFIIAIYLGLVDLALSRAVSYFLNFGF
jgi:preprotein translocase subunit SecE